MAIITLHSLGHSPGTTTLAVALTTRWPRPAILVEADTSTTSSILAGRFRGQLAHRTGLTNLASAATHGELDTPLLWANSIELAEDRRVVPGFATLGAARGAATFWSSATRLLAALDSAGTDVLIDLGRCDADDPRSTMLTSAQLVMLVCGATLPDVAATTAPVAGRRTRLDELTELLTGVGHGDALRLALVERPVESYSAAEIRRVTGIPVLAWVPYAPEAAAAFSLGTPPRSAAMGAAGRRRRAFDRAIDALALAGRQSIEAHRARIGAPSHRETPGAESAVDGAHPSDAAQGKVTP